eukprot:6457314-Amphidinium_carterae.1
MQACGPFLMDVMKKIVRLSGKVLREGALKVQWHNIVRNNIAFELEEAWKSVVKLEKNAKTWGRLDDNEWEVRLAKELRLCKSRTFAKPL